MLSFSINYIYQLVIKTELISFHKIIYNVSKNLFKGVYFHMKKEKLKKIVTIYPG